MESTTAVSTQPQVTVGVDAHKQFHVARAVSWAGRWAATALQPAPPATANSCPGLAGWARSLSSVSKAPATSARAWPGICAARASRSPRSAAPNGSAGHVRQIRRHRRGRSPRNRVGRRSPRRPQVRRRCCRKWCGCCGWPVPVRCAPVPSPTPPLQDLLVTAPHRCVKSWPASAKASYPRCKQLSEFQTPSSTTNAITVAIKSLAARCEQPDVEATRLKHTSTPSLLPPHRSCAPSTVLASTPPPPCWQRSATTTIGSPATAPLPNSAEPARWRPPAAKPSDTDSTAAAPGAARHPGRAAAPSPTHP